VVVDGEVTVVGPVAGAVGALALVVGWAVAEAAWVELLPEPPHAARSSIAAVRANGACHLITDLSLGMRGPPLVNPSRLPASIQRQQMSLSDDLGVPGHRPRSRIVAALDSWSPYWGPQLVVAAALALDFFLPSKLAIGPTWLLPSVEALLLLGLVMASPHPKIRHSRRRRRVAIGLIALVSAVNTVSLVLLVHYLLHGGKGTGRSLIYSGIVLWVTNVLLFGLWYYELDRGGPVARALHEQDYADFLFPQMSNEGAANSPKDWAPRLVDYLYTSFTNATAFSPTDTMPLTAAAKWLMSVQALAALTTIGLVVARAVNILNA
jgi:hypothetical protein